ATRTKSKKSRATIPAWRARAKSSSRFRSRSSCRKTRPRSLELPLLPGCACEGKQQHSQKNREQSCGGFQSAAAAFGQNRKSSVNEFDVHPVHQQRCVTELDDRAEAFLRESPAAPHVHQEKNHQQNSAAHQQKVRIAVPVIVDGVQAQTRRIKQNRQE